MRVISYEIFQPKRTPPRKGFTRMYPGRKYYARWRHCEHEGREWCSRSEGEACRVSGEFRAYEQIPLFPAAVGIA